MSKNKRNRSISSDKFETIPLNSVSQRNSGRSIRITQRYDPQDESEYKSHRSNRVKDTSNLEPNLSTSPMKSIVEDKGFRDNHTSNTKSMTMNMNVSNENYIGEPYKMVFTIGRMNPPTSGHAKLISSLINLARENNLNNIGIVLSSTEDNKNPLSCHEKREYLSEIISRIDPTIQVNIICIKDMFPISSITKLLEINNLFNEVDIEKKVDKTTKMLLLLGQDREEHFNWLKKYFPNLETASMPRPEGAMSATKIRGYVSDNKKYEFIKAYSDILDINSINKLYDDVKNGLSRPQKKSKKRGGRKTIKRKRTIKKRARKSKRRISSHY